MNSDRAPEKNDAIAPSLTSLTLLERVKQEDDAAWQRLVDIYAPLAYRWCRRIGVLADDVPDIVQEVFLAVATHIGDFHRDEGRDSFRGWLWTITRNKINDHWRRRKNQPQARGGSSAAQQMCDLPDRELTLQDADPQSDDDALVAWRVVELIRPEVQDRTWRAFWRLVVDGQSGPEVAAELGMSLQAVHQAKYRVLQRVRQEMSGMTPFSLLETHLSAKKIDSA